MQYVESMRTKVAEGAASAYRGISSAAASARDGAASAIKWSTNSNLKCAVLGTAVLAAGLAGMHALYPASTQHLIDVAYQVKDWAVMSAFPYIKEVIVPAALSKWHSLCEALYTNGAVTRPGAGLIGAAATVLAGAVIYVVYRFFSPDTTKAERDAAIRERDATRTSVQEAMGEKREIERLRNQAAEARLIAEERLSDVIVDVSNAYAARRLAEEQLAKAREELAEMASDEAIEAAIAKMLESYEGRAKVQAMLAGAEQYHSVD